MQIYHYHPVTGLLLITGSADPSPLEPGVYLVPAYATAKKPPVAPAGKRAEFRSGSWQLVDYQSSAPVTPDADPPPTINDVAAERSRRLESGFDYDFGDLRGVHRIGTTEADMNGWSEVTAMANALIATGAGAAQITISTDTGNVSLTAIEWQSILLAAGAFRQPIWQASFVLQQMGPMPNDYKLDSYWT